MQTHQNRYLCVMLRVTTHIERLLAVHDCVVIPQWGGFVLQTVSASYRKEEHAFAPMHKEVVFNAALQHTDGLLTASYMQAYSIDFRKAQALVDSDVEEMKASLARYGKLAFGSIGSFSAGEVGQQVFHPGKTSLFDADYYGLASFQYPVLPPVVSGESAIEGTQKPEADIVYIPVNRRMVRGIIATAAAVALLLLISTPVNNVNQSAYTASVIPTERMMPTSETTSPATGSSLDMTAAEATEENILTDVSAEDVTEPAVEVKKKMYYIVIASFPDEAQANVYIAGVSQRDFSHVATVERDGQHRVYTQAFENREDAESQLAAVRQNEAYQSAWLFISR